MELSTLSKGIASVCQRPIATAVFITSRTSTGGGHVPRTGRRPVVWIGTHSYLRKRPDPERDVLLKPLVLDAAFVGAVVIVVIFNIEMPIIGSRKLT
jgi:hypothetical protein